MTVLLPITNLRYICLSITCGVPGVSTGATVSKFHLEAVALTLKFFVAPVSRVLELETLNLIYTLCMGSRHAPACFGTQ